MPGAQYAIVPLALEAPVRRFRHYQAAVQAMADYQAGLSENASLRRSNGLTVTDQDQPEVAFCLSPAHPDRAALTIVGGMGPLAGALAFHRACARFQDSRAVVLYQACSMPDRSAVILGEGSPDTPLCHGMALRLAGAVRLAVGLAPPARQPARCIVACNSAHYFWRLLTEDLRLTAARPCEVRMISLVESSLEALRFQSRGRALLLATEGARAGEVFSAPCRDAGIAFDEPSPSLSRLLMSAIFEGMKSLDEGRAVELGNEFFETILRSGRDYDCILAGCTELPPTIDLLRLHGSPAVAAFLARVKIVDPVGKRSAMPDAGTSCFACFSRKEPFSLEDAEQSIPAQFERQARLYPERPAVAEAESTLTYRDLNGLANRIARHRGRSRNGI